MNGATLRTRNEQGLMREFEQNADTDLIQAAPELYSALIMARNRLDSGSEDNRKFNAGVVEYIDQVLKKAEGL